MEKINEKINEIKEIIYGKDADMHLHILSIGKFLEHGIKICTTCYELCFESSSLWNCEKCGAEDSVCHGCKDRDGCYYCNYKDEIDDYEVKEIDELKKLINKETNNIVKAFDHCLGETEIEKYKTDVCNICYKIYTDRSFTYCDICEATMCMNCMSEGCPNELR